MVQHYGSTKQEYRWFARKWRPNNFMVVQNVFSGTLVELSQDAMLHSYRMQIHVDVLVFIFLDSFRQISLNGEWREKPNVWTSDAQVGKTEIAAASRTGSNYRHDFFI